MFHRQRDSQSFEDFISPGVSPGSLLEDVDFASFLDLDATHPDQWVDGETFATGLAPATLVPGHSGIEAASSEIIDNLGSGDPIESSLLDALHGGEHFEGDRSTAHSSACTSLDDFSVQDQYAANNASAEHPAKVKKSRRLPVDSTRVLREWFRQHQDYPYPSGPEVKMLESQSNLKKTQILNWFTNARRRKPAGKELSHSVPADDQTLLSPFERWQHSPPESEPAKTRDIIRAAERAPYLNINSDPGPQDLSDGWSSNGSGSSLQFGALSMSSYAYSSSSGSELALSQAHGGYQRPPTPLPGMRRRRRRRKPMRYAHRLDKSARSDKRPFQCTFCSDAFRNKYDWQRHERALHIQVERWNCAPEGGIIEIDGINTCVFCSAVNPDEHHLETHDYLRCRENPPDLRAFSRKDHLQQHLRLVHGVPYQVSMDGWRESKARMLSRCGFCGSNFTTWEDRVDHVAEHFKNKADMGQWCGGWGFEPHVESRVQNAIPPYLLGLERNSMDPWVASDTGPQEVERPPTYQAAPNTLDLYASIHQIVSDYLRTEFAAGNNPSDETVQSLTRVFAYGTDDPFNQTYADDPEFIMCIRRELGMVPDA
ncbi:hypothetical protein N7468_002221 [Penicillium chermesinum]|uniref:Uncharacterized protein n=1 Tax=Penicillium chermesinum TaxID=63820 RepID=A0A9W9TY78_9EURO|nr:uncharacterized protein N7468_002221 [Penicillium chermesinum]KAJ5247238.1 hypothetical protein N7468_002221 [Penicillium chermesinum]KAJ6145481.1 hypothetical protein N7470_009376 [Penicillium chermesinum]